MSRHRFSPIPVQRAHPQRSITAPRTAPCPLRNRAEPSLHARTHAQIRHLALRWWWGALAPHRTLLRPHHRASGGGNVGACGAAWASGGGGGAWAHAVLRKRPHSSGRGRVSAGARAFERRCGRMCARILAVRTDISLGLSLAHNTDRGGLEVLRWLGRPCSSPAGAGSASGLHGSTFRDDVKLDLDVKFDLDAGDQRRGAIK